MSAHEQGGRRLRPPVGTTEKNHNEQIRTNFTPLADVPLAMVVKVVPLNSSEMQTLQGQ